MSKQYCERCGVEMPLQRSSYCADRQACNVRAGSVKPAKHGMPYLIDAFVAFQNEVDSRPAEIKPTMPYRMGYFAFEIGSTESKQWQRGFEDHKNG